MSPTEGTTLTVFRYQVLYKDADDQPPASATVYIDGEPHPMLTDSTGPWSSWNTFYCETTLNAGQNHRHYFLFTDGEDPVRLPLITASPNWLPGPSVELPNNLPVLTAARVSPVVGTRDTEFTFSVTYTDLDGEHPTMSYVYVDGVPYHMAPGGSDYEHGVTFTYETRLSLDAHAFFFRFSDGEDTVTAPGTGTYEGPQVNNMAPTAVIASPPEGARFSGEDTITLSATGSTDPEGDQLTFKWTSDVDGVLGTDEYIEVYLSEGTHEITLEVGDGYEAVSTMVTILVKPYLSRPFIVDIEVSKERPVEGDTVRITVLMGNDGEAKLTGGWIVVELDDTELGREPVSIDVDGSASASFSWLTTPGEHSIIATIDESESQTTVTVTANTPPTAEPKVLNEGETFKPGEELYFKAQAADANGDGLAYLWEFGDGGTSTKESPSHVYGEPGTYTVTLTIQDTRGGEVVETFTVEIARPKKKDDSPGPGALSALATLAATASVAILCRCRLR